MHQHAAGARKIFGNQDMGISRVGKTMKIHALVNENFQLLEILLSGGQFHDNEYAIKLLEKTNIDEKSILADKAYGSNIIRIFIAEHNATSLRDFSIALKTSDILPLAMINCRFAFLIL